MTSPSDSRAIELIEIAEEQSEFARDWRNRYFAHRDRQLA
jgi:hypothetical protein